MVLFDDEARVRLLPFTHTRPIADIRCGIFTMRERWEHIAPETTSTLTETHIQPVFPFNGGVGSLYVNGSVFATAELFAAIKALSAGSKLVQNDTLIAAIPSSAPANLQEFQQQLSSMNTVEYEGKLNKLNYVWDIFSMNGQAIKDDFALITKDRRSAAVPEYVTVVGKENLFIEEGAIINAGCIINASAGPVYIGKGAEVLEGCMLRGPVALCEHAVLKMGAKVYSDTTVGPNCKVGGEVSNVVFFANSNKGHDGYLGNAVIGEWCNLGADTNCSNLKNNYDMVKIWDEHTNRPVRTGMQFCGLLMGDHSKCGINTMFNTGTVVGVSANIYGGDFQEKFIASYSWGGAAGAETYNFNKAMDTAKRMMARRKRELTEAEIAMYRHVFDNTEAQRTFWNKKATKLSDN